MSYNKQSLCLIKRISKVNTHCRINLTHNTHFVYCSNAQKHTHTPLCMHDDEDDLFSHDDDDDDDAETKREFRENICQVA